MEIIELGSSLPAIIAMVGAIVQGVKKLSEKIEAWDGAPDWLATLSGHVAHGSGPVVMSYAIALFVTVLPGVVEDRVLTFPELQQILAALGISAGSNVLYWITRWKAPRLLKK